MMNLQGWLCVMSVHTFNLSSNVEPFCVSYQPTVITYTWISCSHSCFGAYHISKTNFIPQPHEQKGCRRLTQCSSTLCGCLCIWPIWCCPMLPFQMRYFVDHFDQKSCYLCAYHNSRTDFIPQPHEQKSCRRLTQCSSTLYVDDCAPNLPGVVLCNPFKSDVLWFIIQEIPQIDKLIFIRF